MISYIDTILQESSGEFFQVKGQRGKGREQEKRINVVPNPVLEIEAKERLNVTR